MTKLCFDLYNDGAISYEEALRNADSTNELRLQIKLKSTRATTFLPMQLRDLVWWKEKEEAEASENTEA